jgi:hypothetical protein
MMEWLAGILVTFVICLIVQCVRLFLSDCDLELQWAEMFGYSTGKVFKRF